MCFLSCTEHTWSVSSRLISKCIRMLQGFRIPPPSNPPSHNMKTVYDMRYIGRFFCRQCRRFCSLSICIDFYDSGTDHCFWGMDVHQLGATLANHRRSEEALPAYRHAIASKPGYARAWLNMGISQVREEEKATAVLVL